MNCVSRKSFELLSLLLLLCLCQAQPLQEEHTREERQLKSGPATEAEVKMLAASTANMTPATGPMQMNMAMAGGLPMNQMVNMQLARYPNYPGLFFGAGGAPTTPFLGVGGLQTNIANNYPSYTDPSLTQGFGFAPGAPGAGFANGLGPASGLGLGLGAYPGQPQAPGYMYGNPLYGNPQLGNGFGNGFGAQPSVDNFAALNNIINMANAQGLTGGIPPSGLYNPAAAGLGGMPMQPGYFDANAGSSSLLERMNMHSYAPAF